VLPGRRSEALFEIDPFPLSSGARFRVRRGSKNCFTGVARPLLRNAIPAQYVGSRGDWWMTIEAFVNRSCTLAVIIAGSDAAVFRPGHEATIQIHHAHFQIMPTKGPRDG
jgi:hypothetical protein